jgi:exonuclease VII small subunit
MSNDLKFEIKVGQLDRAVKSLEIYKAKGWNVMIESTEKLIKKLEMEIDKLDE